MFYLQGRGAPVGLCGRLCHTSESWYPVQQETRKIGALLSRGMLYERLMFAR